MANWLDVKLPWFVTLLGKSRTDEGFARLCSEYNLTSDAQDEATAGWYENKQLGISVYIEQDRIDAIQFFSQEQLNFGGTLTPSFLGANFAMTREDIRRLFGEPDQVIEARSSGAIQHSGIDRYRLHNFSIAFSYSLESGKLEVISFEK